MTIFRLDSPILSYAWGARTMIADALGRTPSGQPEAELWMGAHPRAPSRVLLPEGTLALDALIAAAPETYLGATVAGRFSGRLPFLMKILAAEQPLSIQAHPSTKDAIEGFAREEKAGVRVGDSLRVYHDENHKPELLCALTPFEALCGFRSPREIVKVLSVLGLGDPEHPLFSEFRRLHNALENTLIASICRAWFALPPERVRAAIDSSIPLAVKHAEASGEFSAEARWFLRFSESYPEDAGVFVAMLLNRVVLEPGEGLFLPEKVVHAYLGGLGIEVMASSDNVLRAGLTKKPINTEELFRVALFEPTLPQILRPELVTVEAGVCVRRYQTSAPEFELQMIELEAGTFSIKEGPAIALVLAGNPRLSDGEGGLALERGEQAFIGASGAVLQGSARVVVATVNPEG